MKERLPDWVQGWLDTIMPIGQVLLILLAAWLVQPMRSQRTDGRHAPIRQAL